MLLIPLEECKRYTRGQIYWCGNGEHPVYISLNGYKYHLKTYHENKYINNGYGRLISEKEADETLNEILLELDG